MTRVLLVGDIHMADRAPSSATDSYADDIIDLLMQAVKLEADLGLDGVIWAGDVFHYKQPSRTSHATVLKMLKVVQQYRNLWIVTGNHDISNDVLESVHTKQPLGILLEAGAHELDGWNCFTAESYPGDADHEFMPIYGVPWQQRWLEEGTPETAFAGWQDNPKGFDLDHALAVTHAPIFPPHLAKDVLYDLVPTGGEHGLAEAMDHRGYLYYGHIHEDHGVFEDEGVIFGNVGAVSRGSLTEYNMERSIQACLWDSTSGFQPVLLKAKPAEEVFKVEEVMEQREAKISLDAFLADVGSRTLQVTSTQGVIDAVRTMDVPDRIKKKTIDLLEEFEQ